MKSCIVSTLILCITYVIIDWFKWELFDGILMKRLLNLFFIAISVVALLVSLCIAIKFLKKTYRKNKFMCFIPLLIIIITIIVNNVLPTFQCFGVWKYSVNADKYNGIIAMLKNDDLEQIDICRYVLPTKYRLLSQTGRIVTTDNNRKVLFYVKCSQFVNSAIVYCDMNTKIQRDDFDVDIIDIAEINNNWYVVKFR